MIPYPGMVQTVCFNNVSGKSLLFEEEGGTSLLSGSVDAGTGPSPSTSSGHPLTDSHAVDSSTEAGLQDG